MKNNFAPSLFLAGTLFVSGVALTLATPAACIAQTLTSQQRQQIEAAVIRAVGQPNLPRPQVSKITLQGQYGLASWLMGEGGGLVALVNEGNGWQAIRLGGGLPSSEDLAQRAGMPISVAQRLLAQYSGGTTQASSTAVPMTISLVEEQMGMVVPDRDTTQSAYGGQLRLYDVHIAKMFEVTHTLCQEIPGLGYLNWVYQAGGGSLFMGRFQVSCKLANDLASAYGLGTPERTR
ncbi:hypothetical protein QQ056_11400 [Oscillatoria laete-virens NRMC-F 0139]|nr:hypothetical protein [Oscillatoria laete-virens]MDL5054147.1 hypothetical protein [Oscillatoria laete-virens NRMC-F 0139]